MADLTAKFELIDEMSSKLEDIAENGQKTVDIFSDFGSSVNDAFDTMESDSESVAKSVDGVAVSISDVNSETENWTEAVGNYDKSALDAIYTTQELVDMGLKSADALENESEMLGVCEKAAGNLSEAQQESISIHDDLVSVLDETADMMDSMADSTDIARETQDKYAEALEQAEKALEELEQAQQDAADAMENYDITIQSGTGSLEDLEGAAEAAGTAAENLAVANEKAASAMEELQKSAKEASDALQDNQKQTENAENTAVGALDAISSALGAAGITVALKQITDSVMEMANAYSEAESIIVDATGATGAALESLQESLMVSYSSTYNDLSTVAGAIGEINTRMGLVGDELSETTNLFLDFSNVTGTSVVSAVESATKIMNKWGDEAGDLTTILDQLTYAGQTSGASVDTLANTLVTGAATFQNAGLSLENTISLLADFELAGIKSTTAVTALRTAVNNFTSEGEDASTALQEVITEIANMEDQSDATALAVETFGSRAGQELALAIRNGTLSVESFNATLEDAEGTLESTAEASLTMADRWSEANNKVASAFSSVLSPVVESFSVKLSDMWGKVGDWLADNPAVVKALSAAAVGLGVVAGAVAAVTVVVKVAIPVVQSFGTAFNTALGPIGWVALAVAGVTAAVTAFIALTKKSSDEYYTWTAATKAQYNQLQELNAEYDEAVEKYGATSDEASALKYQIDDLTASFEANKQTIEEYAQAIDEMISSHQDAMASIDDTISGIENSELTSLSLVAKLNDLADATNNGADAQDAMQAIIDSLNDSVSGLNLSYDDLISNQGDVIEYTKEYIKQQAEQEKQYQEYQKYIELLEYQLQCQDELATSSDNLKAAQEALNQAKEDWANLPDGMSISQSNANLKEAQDAYDTAYDTFKAMQSELKSTNKQINEIEGSLFDVGETTEDTADIITDWETVAYTAFSNVQDQIADLCQAYDDAYEAAVQSFEGQFDLFDQAQADAEATVASAMESLESQKTYWEQYHENLQSLMSVSAEAAGTTQENLNNLIEWASSGTEEAAGLVSDIQGYIDSGNLEMVGQLADLYSEVAETRGETAQTVADWQVDFTGQMQEFSDTMDQMIDDMVENMDCSEEAGEVAKSVLDRYTQQIATSGEDAVTAAQNVADRIAKALSVSANVSVTTTTSTTSSKASSSESNAYGTTNSSSSFYAGEFGRELVLPAHAAGTTSGENAFIAGDDGPELIVGKPGSTVFPSKETDRLINALNGTTGQSESGGVKRIVLEIAGSGEIEIGPNTSQEDVLEILQQYLKPVLLQLLKQEIYEEGEKSYVY